MGFVSTIGVKLGYRTGNSGAYTDLLGVTGYPDLGAEPEMIETTTLADEVQKFIPGVKSNEALAFPMNLLKEEFLALKAHEAARTNLNWLQTMGDLGMTVAFSGVPTLILTGAGVNEVIACTLSITPSTGFDVQSLPVSQAQSASATK